MPIQDVSLRMIKSTSFIFLLLLPISLRASFIETTIGAAVVNDATASYFNPAALTLLNNAQIIQLGTVARFNSKFTGSSKTLATGFIESGSTSSNTNYFSPSLYFGIPATDRITFGFAAVSNYAFRNADDASLLRYVQASNNIEDYDFVPAIGVKINDYLSLGGGINFSYANFTLHPITGFPGSNIADSQSNNQSSGTGVGGNVGFLIRPTSTTLIGFNYRSVTTYRENGKSVFNGPPQVTSNNYHFKLHTPARSILTVNQFITSKLGVISTIQFWQWNIVKNIAVYNIATPIGATSASVPFYMHDSWLFTLGGQYRFNPKWVLRVAGTYNATPDNGHYQIINGNSYVLGASVGYTVNKTLKIDGSYAHIFIQNANINTTGSRFLIVGTNQGSRDGVTLKLTVNV